MADQITEKHRRLLIRIQAHFTPKIKLRKKIRGVIEKQNRTIVMCETGGDGKIILPPVIKRLTSFGGDQLRKPKYNLFISEKGGPKPIWSDTEDDRIEDWEKGFSLIISGPNGEKLPGFILQQARIKPQEARVLFRGTELCRLDVRYRSTRDEKIAFLTITRHTIINGDEPQYQMKVLLDAELNLNENYLGALDDILEDEDLEDFLPAASVAVEMGFKFPNGYRPKSPDLRNLSNRERATVPIFYKPLREKKEVALEEVIDFPEETAENIETLKEIPSEIKADQEKTTKAKEKKKTTKKKTKAKK